jgi:hypothetical protein
MLTQSNANKWLPQLFRRLPSLVSLHATTFSDPSHGSAHLVRLVRSETAERGRRSVMQRHDVATAAVIYTDTDRRAQL